MLPDCVALTVLLVLLYCVALTIECFCLFIALQRMEAFCKKVVAGFQLGR